MTVESVALLTEAEAERLTERIGLKLGMLADTYEAVMPLIREAIDRKAHEVLGYPSIGAYAADRFGDRLTRLGVEMRRDVVKELTAAGMSTRAIAPVVGVGKTTVERDLAAGPSGPPDPEPSNVVGLDGKQYTRPEPRIEPILRPEPVFTDRRRENTLLLDRICRLAEPPQSQQREHAASWAKWIDMDDTTLGRLDAAITYLTLLREELAR